MQETTSTSPPTTTPPPMHVVRSDGSRERVDVTRIITAIQAHAAGLEGIDAMRVAIKTIGGLYDGATTRELDELAIRTAAGLIFEEPAYSRLAARLLASIIADEVASREITTFSSSVEALWRVGIVSDELHQRVSAEPELWDSLVDHEQDKNFEYFGLRTVYDRYLLKHPETREVLERPQFLWMRVAVTLTTDPDEAARLYKLLSRLEYLPSSPTLFNSGTRHEQLSSCFLLDSPADDLRDIYSRYADVAMLSKFSGGIGMAYHRVRSRGSLIASTNGRSNGIVPWLKTLDASVSAVNQGGRRKGACCVYLEPWHADIEEFLELRDNTGDEAARTHNLNLANWIPDLFMKRVEAGKDWSLFDPKDVPQLPDLFGEPFEAAYREAEAAGLAKRTIPARTLYGRMMRTLAQTGNGWITFKDISNRTCNQTGKSGQTVHLSNLCTEILEVTDAKETAVCNLGSINLSRHTRVSADGSIEVDAEKLARTVRVAINQLDSVIDRNLYPLETAGASNARWRPVGLGVMGLQDVLFQMRVAFDDERAQQVTAEIAEVIYFNALSTSCDLAEEHGAHDAFELTRAASGELQFDSWGVAPSDPEEWEALRQRVMKTGLRNSLLVAIAPTATIASIAGCYECIEPQVSNLFKRETLSGDFIQVNRYLVADLKAAGLWTAEVRDKLKLAEGSVQSVSDLSDEMRALYRTAWELPMRSIIDMAAARGPFIDQSQSLNLFVESPNINRLSAMYFYAWQKGLKTTYYLRSRPATSIAKTTVSGSAQRTEPDPKAHKSAEALACSLENPEYCEACQ